MLMSVSSTLPALFACALVCSFVHLELSGKVVSVHHTPCVLCCLGLSGKFPNMSVVYAWDTYLVMQMNVFICVVSPVFHNSDIK